MASRLEKKKRIAQIKQLVYAAHDRDKGIVEDEFISEFGVAYGIARRKMLEYLHDLENIGVIERTLGEIWLTKKEADKKAREEADKILGMDIDNEEKNNTERVKEDSDRN